MGRIGSAGDGEGPEGSNSNANSKSMLKANNKTAFRKQLQKSRSRIRRDLSKKIITTYSKDGFDIDPERKTYLYRQFEDNKEAFERKIDQERQRLHQDNLRKVNRSFNRLET